MATQELEEKVIEVLKTVYDPEIPVNIYELGLIYEISIDEQNNLKIMMTLTAPTCPIAGEIVREVQEKTEKVEGINSSSVELTFDPPWDMTKMTLEAKMELGFL